MKTRFMAIALSAALIAAASASADEAPAYTTLELGEAVEVSGDWDKDAKAFTADEIEVLPVPRRPKLRGVIEAADSANQRIQVFGQWIDVTEKTQFLNVEDLEIGFSILRPGERIELSCKVDTTGAWTARHLRIRGVKDSDKIKGNITRIEFDGKAPESFYIQGLPILVNDKTILFKTLGATEEADDDDEETTGNSSQESN